MHDDCVSRVPVFAALTAAEREQVARLAQPVHVEAGDLVADERSAAKLLFVHSGRLKALRSSRDGAEHLVQLIGPGDFIGESDLLTGQASHHLLVAMEPTVACAFAHASVQRLLQQHPSMALRMLSALSRRLQSTEERLAALHSSDVITRLAEYLLDLPAEFQDGRVSITLPLLKKDVAALLGTTPESLSRALARLVRAGLVRVEGSSVTILDAGRLAEWTTA